MKNPLKLLNIGLACALCLATSALLQGCSKPPVPSAGSGGNSYCQQLQQQMVLNNADTQPGVNSSLTNQAMLMQRYRSYECPALLDPSTQNSAKQQLMAPPEAKHPHRNHHKPNLLKP
jgi:hypothetical protein